MRASQYVSRHESCLPGPLRQTIQIQYFLVLVRSGLNELFPPRRQEFKLRLVQIKRRELFTICFLVKLKALHFDKVVNSLEFIPLALRILDRKRIGTKLGADGFHNLFEIRTQSIHLVDKSQLRNRICLALPPDRLGLRLNATHTTEHAHRTVKHAQGPLDLNGEIHMAGRVDNVDHAG